MSDEKPFASMSHEGTGPYLWMEDVQFAAYECDGDPFKAMDKINSAVSARERKAAAQALREASVDLIAAFDGYAHDVSAWLRSRAAALEGGAT